MKPQSPLAVANVTAPVPPEEILGQGRQEFRAVRAGAGAALWDPALHVLGAAGCAAAGWAAQGTRALPGPLLHGAAVGFGVQGRGRAGGHWGQRGQLGGRAAGAPRAGQVG